MFHLYSAEKDLVRYGAAHYRAYSDETSSLLSDFVAMYREEGLSIMAETLQEYGRRKRREMVQDPETRRELLAEMTPEQLLEALTPEQRVAGLSLEELVKSLTPEQRAALLEQLKQDQPSNGSPDAGA